MMLPGADLLSDNLHRLKQRLRFMMSRGQTPIVLVDFDDTLNRGYGANIDDAAAQAFARLDAVGALFGLNSGAPIEWAGLRVLSRLPPPTRCPLSLLATGRRAYAWNEPSQAYVELPISAASKGEGLRVLAEFLRDVLPTLEPRAIYIGDFPGPGDAVQPGIDDSVVREAGGALAAIIDVGTGRASSELGGAPDALVLCPPDFRTPGLGVGFESTVRYLDAIASVLGETRYQPVVSGTRRDVQDAIARRLHLPAAATDANFTPRCLSLDRGAGAAYVDGPGGVDQPEGPLRLRLSYPALVHAGVRDATGKWNRVYDLLLRPSAAAAQQWETVLPPDVNVFTLAHYDFTGNGHAHWDGVDYRIVR